MGRERRITATVGTIPANTALAGVVTTSSVDNTKLIYTGSDDIADIMNAANTGYNQSVYWLYVPGQTPYVSRVIGIYKNTTSNYTLTLETAIAGCSSDACAYVQGAITYSYVNDGAANCTVNGVTVKPGEGANYNPYEKYGNRPQLQPVCYVDASASDVFIVEEL